MFLCHTNGCCVACSPVGTEVCHLACVPDGFLCAHTCMCVCVARCLWAEAGRLCPVPQDPCTGLWERLCTRFLGHQLSPVHLHSVGMLSHVVIVKITVKSSPVNLWTQLQWLFPYLNCILLTAFVPQWWYVQSSWVLPLGFPGFEDVQHWNKGQTLPLYMYIMPCELPLWWHSGQ